MSSDKGADDVLYIEHGDFTVCTCGARQSLIEVKSQMYVKRENGHLIATEKDRMHPCHICLKATTAATVVGAISGLMCRGLTFAGAVVGAIVGAVVGGYRGYDKSGGSVWGAIKGAVKGAAGGARLGLLGYGVWEGIKDALLAQMAMKVVNICAFFTRSFFWTKVHPKVRIGGHRALLEGAKLGCTLGGVVSVIKPNYSKASDMLCLSYFTYDRKTAEEKELVDEAIRPYERYDFEEAVSKFDDDYKEELTNKLKSKELAGYKRVEGKELDYLGISTSDLQNRNHGFKAEVYTDSEGNCILAFRGTTSDPRDMGKRDLPFMPNWSWDWIDDNASQGLGLGSEQYEDAIRLAQKINANKPEGKELIVTGHSLGGGLATAAGAATGSETYAFNPAGVHPNTYEMYGVKNPDTSKVHTYYSNQDFLNMGNNLLELMPDSAGERIRLHTADEFDFADGHDLPLLLQAIEKKKAEQSREIIAKEYKAM